MGIKGLSAFLKKKCSSAFQTLNSLDSIIKLLNEVSEGAQPGVAVDVASIFYRVMYSANDVNCGCLSFIELFKPLHDAGIKIYFVFDGAKKPNKRPEQARRQAKANIDREKIEKLKNVVSSVMPSNGCENDWMNSILDAHDTINKLQQRLDVVRPADYYTLSCHLTICGFATLTSRDEGEAAATWLVKNKYAHAVVTDDFDALPFGAHLFIRNYGSRRFPCEAVHLDSVLDGMCMTHDMFVQFCVLCGSDFTEHLPGMGPVKAAKTITTYKSLQAYCSSTSYDVEYKNIHFEWEKAMRQFVNIPAPLPSLSFMLYMIIILKHIKVIQLLKLKKNLDSKQ